MVLKYFFEPKAPHRLYLMEIGQPNSAAMQATAPFGSPECTFLPPRSTLGRLESAVAYMGALVRCPISIK